MQKVTFLGVEHRISKAGNKYGMLHVGSDIKKDGFGVKPMSFKLSEDEVEDFNENAMGDIIDVSYEVVQEMSGNYRFILKSYKLG